LSAAKVVHGGRQCKRSAEEEMKVRERERGILKSDEGDLKSEVMKS
jgi:hypothetical protein